MTTEIPALGTADLARLTAGGSMWTTAAIPAAGIPSLRLSDGPMGIASPRVDERDVARLTPCAVSLGASFDAALVERIGTLVGSEAVRNGVDLVLAPNVNLARSPLAGRAFEYFSEDPLLVGCLGAAWVRGVQSSGTGAVPKHLVCNDSETDRDRVDVRVEERTLREVYLLPFELCAEAGAAAMLTAYNRVNGNWCSEQTHVTTIVKAEWGFKGPLISDWFGTHSTQGSLNGGLDLEMPGPGRFLGDKASDAVDAGIVSRDRLANAAGRVASLARAFGGEKRAIMIEDADALLVEAAAAGMVLLRNAGSLLPLSPDIRRLAIIGPNAAAPCYQGGTFAKIAVAPDTPTPLDAIMTRFGSTCEVVHEPGVDPTPRLPTMPVTSVHPSNGSALPGMTIEYFANTDVDTSPVMREVRATNSLTWFKGVQEAVNFDAPATVRATGWFEAGQAGDYTFYVGATGAVRLRVRGQLLLDHDAKLTPGDVMGVLKSGESESVSLSLQAGERVLVEIVFSHQPARAHGLWFGIRSPDNGDAMRARAIAAARDADAVVLVLGESSDASVESKDRPDTRIDPAQTALAADILAANPNTVIIVNVGHAFDASFARDAKSLLVAWYPGEGFGRALAEVLSGDREPAGRLPVTLAASENDYPALSLKPAADGSLVYDDGVLVGYRGLMAQGTSALHAFGSGIGYTRFSLLEARVDGSSVIVTLRNDGDRRGHEVVQLYRSIPEPALVGFAKIALDAGETGDIRVTIEPRMMRTWRDGWEQIPGPIQIAIGRASDDLPLSVQFQNHK